MRAVLRRADFRLLFVGLAASMVGDMLLMLVLSIWVRELTGSNGAAGATILCMALPGLFGPLLGWGVDRFARRPFLIWGNILSAVALLPLLAVRGPGQTWIVYAVAVAFGLSGVLLGGALSALIKDMLPEELLAEANGALQTVREGLRLGAPIAGAAIYATAGGALVGIIDAVSFLVAAGAIALLKVRAAPVAPAQLAWWGEITAGVRHLFGEPALRRTTVGVGGATLAFGLLDSMIFALVDHGLHRSAPFISVMVTVQGAGALVGGLTAAKVIHRRGEVGTIGLGMVLLAVALGAFAAPVGPAALLPIVLAGAVVAGVGLPWAFVAISTLLQKRTPGELMGRANTAAGALLSTPQILALGLGSILASFVDYRLVVGVAGVVVLGVAVYLWRARGLTTPGTAPVPEEALV
ncbi:MFS transporter [Longispora sp. NPDC051575]|uniref:MFS transporter n=1 Tax=Longispora sp. NPDC051575 TaxID=3154943 RepID=UPI003431D1D2